MTRKYKYVLFGGALLACFTVIAIWYWFLVKKQDSPSLNHELVLSFLDIGQGDATFITFPNGQQMLVDCAIDARILEALGRAMPFRDFTIDYLVVTHPDLDHYGGCVDVLKRFDVAHTIYSGYQKETIDYFDVFQEAMRSEGQYREISQEEKIVIASTTIDFLYPDHQIRTNPNIPGGSGEVESNNTSIVLKLSYGDQDVLLTGDMEAPLEKYLVATYKDILDVEVLKVGHHGSGSSSSEEFLEVVTPQHAVISAGAKNKYGHPSGRVLKRLERAGTRVWRTDQMGDIIAHITPTETYVQSQQER